ncbi:glycosyltransferase family 2 protein [Prevotella histicola]|uniref:glycosyltransferase family 2 protein n=1 Tax=Prevotella histicola TaxID=470565 RepID=UPI0028EA71A1|nr:glycosyltransferase family 2 protein [Prevotella histicola]
MKTFSIIIPTYNNLELFKGAYHSICMQEFKDYEIIIVDDSSDSCIEEYVDTLMDKDIIYHHNIPSLGAVNNWNIGLNMAKGKYIIVLHHDEAFVEKTYLRTLKDNFDSRTYDVIVSQVKVFNNMEEKVSLFSKKQIELFLLCPSFLFLCNVIGPCSCVSFSRSKLVDFDSNLTWLVDVDWYYRLLKGSKRVFLDNLHVNSFNDHNDKITNLIDIKATEIKDVALLKKKYKYHVGLRLCLFLNKCIILYNLKDIIKRIIRK